MSTRAAVLIAIGITVAIGLATAALVVALTRDDERQPCTTPNIFDKCS